MRLRAAAAAAVAAYLRGRYFICITVAKWGLPGRGSNLLKVRLTLTVTSPLAVEHTSREWERSVYVVSGDPAAAIAGSAAPAIAAGAAAAGPAAADGRSSRRCRHCGGSS